MISRKNQAIGLVAGGLIALVAGLSTHVVMLQYLHVPYPDLPHTGWVRLPDQIMQTAGLTGLLLMLSPRLNASPPRTVLVLLVVFLLVTETLFRDPFMEVVNLSNLTLYPFLDVVPTYLTAAILIAALVATRRYLTTWAGATVATLVYASVTYLVIRPLLEAASVPVHAWTAAREGHELYAPPYDWHIVVPAYVTYAEPVIGAFLVCAFASSRLPAEPLRAWAILALIIFAMRGTFFACFTYIPSAPFDAVTAILSEGQFAAENAVLATIVAATWIVAVHRKRHLPLGA